MGEGVCIPSITKENRFTIYNFELFFFFQKINFYFYFIFLSKERTSPKVLLGFIEEQLTKGLQNCGSYFVVLQ